MPEPKAFIAIERTMAAAMRSGWYKRARALANQLQPLIDEGKWGDAQTVVNQITLEGVVSGVHRKIEEMAVSALLFGAHHAAGSVKDTALAKGKGIPQEMAHAIAQLVHMVEKDGRDYVCKQLHQAIEALKRADEAAHLQKDDIAEPDLASNGGLQQPEQAPKKRKLKKSAQTLVHPPRPEEHRRPPRMGEVAGVHLDAAAREDARHALLLEGARLLGGHGRGRA